MKHFDHAFAGCTTRQPLMEPDDFTDLVPNRKNRVKRCHRLLEDHRNPVAPNFAHLKFRKFQQALAIEKDIAVLYFAGRIRYQANNGMGGDTFTAAGFSYQTQCFTGLDRQAHFINGFSYPSVNIKIRS